MKRRARKIVRRRKRQASPPFHVLMTIRRDKAARDIRLVHGPKPVTSRRRKFQPTEFYFDGLTNHRDEGKIDFIMTRPVARLFQSKRAWHPTTVEIVHRRSPNVVERDWKAELQVREMDASTIRAVLRHIGVAA